MDSQTEEGVRKIRQKKGMESKEGKMGVAEEWEKKGGGGGK